MMSLRMKLGWGLAGLVAAAGLGLTAAAATGFGFDPAAAEGDPPRVRTAEVTRQDLISTTEQTGTFGYAAETGLEAAGGTITWLPTVGTAVERGGQLYRVDEAPTILLYGGLPAYRSLRSGVHGQDVRQFEENLAALGYTGFDVDDAYTWATAEAVMEWQEDLGLEQTGIVIPERVHYSSGPVLVTARSAEVGDPAAGTVLTVAASDRTVTVDLEQRDSRFAVVGATVEVQLPDGTTFQGTISAVQATVIDGQDGGDDKTVQRVTITPNDQSVVSGAPSSDAKVAFTADRREDVLTVPVTALLALAEGGYGVELVDGDETRLVPVQAGLFADGRVEISGDGISEGSEVVVAE